MVGNVHKAYWYATVAAIAHPSMRKLGLQMGSYGIRATAAATSGAIRGVAKTTFVRGGTASLATVPGSIVRSLANPYTLAGFMAVELTDRHMKRVSRDADYSKSFVGGWEASGVTWH